MASILSSTADRWSSPISVGTRGRGSPLLPRHSLTPPLRRAFVLAPIAEVALQFCRSAATVRLASTAIEGVKKVQLVSRASLHALKNGLEKHACGPRKLSIRYAK